MGFDTNRRALRASLPWLLAGYVLLVVSVGAWILAASGLFAESWPAPAIERGGAVAGLVGSGLILVGGALLARARIAGRTSPWLAAFFGLWLVEFALRLLSFTLPEPHPRAWLAARLVASAAAGLSLASGMLWIWDGLAARRSLRPWRWTRALFALQLGAYLLVPLVASMSSDTTGLPLPSDLLARAPAAAALLWAVFALPLAQLVLSLRAAVRMAAERTDVGDTLRAGVPSRSATPPPKTP